MEYSGCRVFPKFYSAQFIKEISGNRFILVSNYGYKIYSLNEKNEYTITLLEDYHDGLKTIIELNNNDFIFLSQIECGASLGEPAHNILVIDRIKLKEISESEKMKKLVEIKKRDNDPRYFVGYRNKKEGKNISEEEIKNVIESLKYMHVKQQFLEYSTYGSHHYFKGNAILKNKYLIVAIDYNILIFDISSSEQLKRYEILLYGEDNLYKCEASINKWNNNKNNEFIMNIGGNIIIFELINENELKIINQIYFKDIKYLKKLIEASNKFYDDGEMEDLDSDSYYYEDENKTYSVSIF